MLAVELILKREYAVAEVKGRLGVFQHNFYKRLKAVQF